VVFKQVCAPYVSVLPHTSCLAVTRI